MAMECVLTFLLVTVILVTAANARTVGHNAALAVGAMIAPDGLFAAPISGASMNPARLLGPALVSGQMVDASIYVIRPLVGAAIAVAMARAQRGENSPDAREAASGDG